ncbi:21523_t:CDS:2 [Entrophospora sp. SA101]|nr:21523_t:CDS:2 [Entrophospora sp. SA101]
MLCVLTLAAISYEHSTSSPKTTPPGVGKFFFCGHLPRSNTELTSRINSAWGDGLPPPRMRLISIYRNICPGNAVVENVETGESSSAALPDDLREYNFRSLPGENSSLGSSDNAASNSELFLQQGEVEKQMDKERQIMQVYFHSSIFHT